jgi:hypothetical protein
MKPPRRHTYVPGVDGLPARVVGPWVDRKVHFTDRFTQMFATGMKNKWPRRTYIELFAGPGQSFDRARGVYLEGSAMRAMRAEFTDYISVDIDPVATRALRQRTRGIGLSNPPLILTADCNRAVDTPPDRRGGHPCRLMGVVLGPREVDPQIRSADRAGYLPVGL